MTEEADLGETPRVPPNGSAYEEAQRQVRERNDNARKAGMEERADRERRVAKDLRDERARGEVFK